MSLLPAAQSTLLHIVHCPNVAHCRADGTTDHPCATIVNLQRGTGPESFQVPEPWSGRLESAPILFLSSNPSINELEEYPTQAWPDDHIVDFFANRFGGGRKPWVVDGTRGLLIDGNHARSTRFWAAVRQRASEILERPAQPGIDFALTEVVHCKSRAEAGVRQAHAECVRMHLGPVLAAAKACAIIALGAFAQETLAHEFGLRRDTELHGPVEIWGRFRLVVFLPHPASFAPAKTLTKRLPARDLNQLREFVKGQA